jgi:D-alanyl-D-alanine carboxypeptidase
MKQLFTFLVIFIFVCNLNAQTFDKQKMDSLFALIGDNDKAMGSISLFKDGKEVYQRSIGYADVENKIRASAQTKYRIGSISKIFTATIIMQLVEENKLSLDNKLSEYFSELPNAEKISVEQLLRHRSGLFNFTNADDYSLYMQKPQSKEFIIKKIIKNGIIFEPGDRMEYSNTNYLLLSYIIEKIENKDYSEILKARIVKPCNLLNTYYGGKINSKNNEAFSYKKMAGWEPETETDMSVPSGAGGIVSTPTDLNIFLNCLWDGKLVSKTSLDKMKTMVDKYGFALTVIPFYEKKAFGHGGAIDGFRSTMSYFPDDRVAVSYITNGGTMPMNDVMIGVLSIYFGKDYKLPEFTPSMNLESTDLDQYLGIYGSPNLPLKLTILKKDNTLMGQGTGQPSFPLEAFGKNKFRFEQAGVEIEFNPEGKKLTLKQGGGTFEMTKEPN